MKPWVLITGASAGIGYELAKLFAADGGNLVLVARDAARLEKFAAELRAAHGIEVKVLAKDLAHPESPKEIFAALRDTPVSILVNNAGFGWHGEFARGEISTSLDMMHVNMDALVELTHLFLPPMLARRAGKIMNVASTAAFQPGPFAAIYYATKAFVYSFSCALAEELTGTGVTVTTFCPGGTRTEFHKRAGMERTSGRMPQMDAATAAHIGYRGLLRGKLVIVPGVSNKIISNIASRMPTRLMNKVVRKLNKV